MTNVRSITPNDPANFTPELGNYKTLQPFRYWCQKVLPLVYDDSLSYYELLCKVVDYLNKIMEDVETLHGDVTNLYTAYEQLQNYVNTYFSSLDVQEEINNKLDALIASGEFESMLTRMFNDYIDYITPEIFNCKGDGITDDTENLKKAITYAINNHVQLRGSAGKSYLITSDINCVGTLNWDGRTSTMILNNCSIIFNNEVMTNFCNILNLTIRANSAKTPIIFKNVTRSKVSNIIIYDSTANYMEFSGECFETVVSNVRLVNSNAINNATTGIVVESSDMIFERIFGYDIHVFIHNNAAGNTFNSCHAWLYSQNLLLGSICYKVSVSAQFTNCISDTYETGFSVTDTSTSRLTGCMHYLNPEYYNPTLTSVKSTFIKIVNGNSGSNLRVTSCWVYYPENDPNYFSNAGKITRIKMCNNSVNNVLDPLYNNVYYNNDSIFGDYKTDKFTMRTTDTSVWISSYIYFTEKANKKIGTLPAEAKPTFSHYCPGMALDNTTGESKIVYFYFDISGDIYVNTTNTEFNINCIILDHYYVR
jgi:hypothetical protein